MTEAEKQHNRKRAGDIVQKWLNEAAERNVIKDIKMGLWNVSDAVSTSKAIRGLSIPTKVKACLDGLKDTKAVQFVREVTLYEENETDESGKSSNYSDSR